MDNKRQEEMDAEIHRLRTLATEAEVAEMKARTELLLEQARDLRIRNDIAAASLQAKTPQSSRD